MPTPTVVLAEQLAALLLGQDIPATIDPRAVAGLAPVVLIPPPRLAFDGYGGPSRTWRLLAVSSTPDPVSAWRQLDELLDAVAAVLPVETAEPISFAAAPGDDPLPAYAMTLTE